MSIKSTANNAVNSIRRALNRNQNPVVLGKDTTATPEVQFSQAARTIARAPLSTDATDTVDLSAAAVALLAARNNFEATTKFIKTSDEVEQSLISTLG